MEKSKLGVSICLLSALTFMAGMAGIFPVALVAGYILLKEENVTLRANAVCSIVLCVLFTLLSYAASALVGFVGLIDFGSWMYEYDGSRFILNFFSEISKLVSFAELIVFGLFALLALLGKNVKIGFINKLVEKHM